MSEIKFIVINTEDRWRMGKEITEQETIELKKDKPINLEISNEGLSLKLGSKQGTYVTNGIDSTIADCIWHRLVMDAHYTEGARVEVAYAIADEDIKDMQELQNKWSDLLINPKDVLIVGQRGKYIWLRIAISLSDAGIKAPTIKSVKLYFPRETYLRYLPAIYQEDLLSRDFLERYLSVFETVLTKFETSIEDVPRFFDVLGTPPEFLPWLSTWLGTVQDENWPEDKWREFLSRAVELYKQRGTPKGLGELIKIYSGKYPIIVERGLLKCENNEFGKVLDRLFGCLYSFCVLVQPDQVKTETDRKVLKRIVDVEKPAHTCGGLVVIEPWIRLDWHSYLGINTTLNRPKHDMRIGKAVLPINTVVIGEPLNTICKNNLNVKGEG
jgi:phage tail-like protein